MERISRPSAVCSRCLRLSIRERRLLSTTRSLNADTDPSTMPTATAVPLDPELVSTIEDEKRLKQETGKSPVGSRRRRAILGQIGKDSITFEQMPYQCFQEARKLLQEDRREKLVEIEARRARIARLQAQPAEAQNERIKEVRLQSMRKALEELKIHADINDPLVKKKFEDGKGDLSKPIYRFLADRKWREYKRKILMQRIEQMNVVPDVLPAVDPIVSTDISFGTRKVQHGEIVPSKHSEKAPQIKIQPYDHGSRLVTIAVINADVPNVAKDAFDYRCHYLACNVPISPTSTMVDLAALDRDSQVVLPWLSPYAQRGLDYQRLAVCIMEQPQADGSTSGEVDATRSQPLDVAAMKAGGRDSQRQNLTARALITRHRLRPVGIDLFRTKYDEDTAAVMDRAGVIGSDIEFKRKRIDPLPYKRLGGGRYR